MSGVNVCCLFFKIFDIRVTYLKAVSNFCKSTHQLKLYLSVCNEECLADLGCFQMGNTMKSHEMPSKFLVMVDWVCQLAQFCMLPPLLPLQAAFDRILVGESFSHLPEQKDCSALRGWCRGLWMRQKCTGSVISPSWSLHAPAFLQTPGNALRTPAAGWLVVEWQTTHETLETPIILTELMRIRVENWDQIIHTWCSNIFIQMRHTTADLPIQSASSSCFVKGRLGTRLSEKLCTE